MVVNPMLDPVLRAVHEVAKPLGYAKSGSRFYRLMGDGGCAVWYQTDREPGRTRFTANLEVCYREICDPPVATLPRSATLPEQHWQQRIGYLLPEQRDVWWDVDGSNADEVAEQQAAWFHDLVHPRLVVATQLSWAIDEWRAGRGAWTDVMRADFLRRAADRGLVARTDVPEAVRDRSPNRILAGRREIAEQLWLRDEPDLARAMLSADDRVHRRVLERASEPAQHFARRDTVDELLVVAAIAELEGVVRPPARWTPRPEEHLAGFVEAAGSAAEEDHTAAIRRLLDELR